MTCQGVRLEKNRMKRLKLLVVFGCVLFSCHKNHVVEENTIIGQWEWIETPGSFGVPETPQSTGKSWSLTFISDSSFTNEGNYYIMQVIPHQHGTFNLNSGNLINGLGNGTYVTLRSPNMLAPQVFKYSLLSNNDLILDSGSPFDAPAFYFVRR